MFPIPIVFISSNIQAYPEVTTLDHILEKLKPYNDIDCNLIEWIITDDKNIMLWEMIRVFALNKNIPDLSRLYNCWIELGYSNNEEGVLVGFNIPDQPLNPKVSMMLNGEIRGVIAYCPLDLWHTINIRFQK